MVRAILVGALMLGGSPALSEVPNRGEWFESLRYPCSDGSGECSCCDTSDCKRTRAEQVNGVWFALAPDTQDPDAYMVPVPPEAIIRDPRTIDGDAYICTTGNARFGTIKVRCFIEPWVGH